jgi:hypothetical protein
MECTTFNALAVIAAAALATCPLAASAQTTSAASVQMVKAGGQLNAYAVACGKATSSQVAAKHDAMRKTFVGNGMATATFDSTYDAGYATVATAAKADPARMQAACAQLETKLKAMEAQAQAKP